MTLEMFNTLTKFDMIGLKLYYTKTYDTTNIPLQEEIHMPEG